MNKSRFMKDAVILFAVVLVSGFLLGDVYQLTKKPTELVTIAANNKAYRTVFAEAETFSSDEALTAVTLAYNEALAGVNFSGIGVENVLRAVGVGGSQLGYIITSLSDDSYGGIVKLSMGLEDGGAITGIEFLEISDTPGLGLKAKESALKGQYAGKNAPELSVTKSDSADDAQVGIISGATITSSATTSAVNAVLYYLHNCIQ